jgi:hypothetical protein
VVERRRRRRRAVALAVLATWLVVLAWHVRREYFRPLAERLAEASANVVPTAAFYSITLGDAPIGYAATRIDTLPDGFVVEDDMRLRVKALGSDIPAAARTRVRLGSSLALRDFSFTLRSDIGRFNVDGEMSGDTLLQLRILAGGDEQSLQLATEGPVVLPSVMPLRFALGAEPEVGEAYAFEIFDPSVMERQKVTLEVLGKETLIVPDSAVFDAGIGKWVTARTDTVETWHVRQEFGGVELESWLDPDGVAVKATSPLGFTIERTAFEIAWNEYRQLEMTGGTAELDAGDIIESTAISVGVTLPESERLTGLAVRLRDVDLSGFDLDGDRQRLSGDTLFVGAGSIPVSVGYALPADPEEWGTELAGTPLIQIDDAVVRRAALEALGGTSDPKQAAARLNEWVHENLEKRLTLSVPSARQVLDARSGDCNEHTVLYVALARAVGLPARTAAGLVYVRGRFYYHAWPEVWLDEWVPVDPTLGQFPADASHLRFVVGGLVRQVELVRLIGHLRLEVVSVEER